MTSYEDNNFFEIIQNKKEFDYHDYKEYNLDSFENTIIYGKDNIGKYTHALNIIQQYSPSQLKYMKKLTIDNNKTNYYIRISDIHYEVDFGLLGCNAKTLWNSILTSIKDILKQSTRKYGIILCINFNKIHEELLEIFYNYMQDSDITKLKFLLVTNSVGFMPSNIINSCILINLQQQSKKITNKYNKENSYLTNLNNSYKIYGNNLKEIIINPNSNVNKFGEIRDQLYNLLIFNIDISECLWYILKELIADKHLAGIHITNSLNYLFNFFQLYNNNYRPIYHLERIIIYLLEEVNECRDKNKASL